MATGSGTQLYLILFELEHNYLDIVPRSTVSRHMSTSDQTTDVLHSDKGIDSTSTLPYTASSTETDDICMDDEGLKDATSVPLYLYGYSSRDTDAEAQHKCSSSTSLGTENISTGPLPLLSRSENLCVRHQRMADEGANARLQKVRIYSGVSARDICMYSGSNCSIPHGLLYLTLILRENDHAR